MWYTFKEGLNVSCVGDDTDTVAFLSFCGKRFCQHCPVWKIMDHNVKKCKFESTITLGTFIMLEEDNEIHQSQ